MDLNVDSHALTSDRFPYVSSFPTDLGREDTAWRNAALTFLQLVGANITAFDDVENSYAANVGRNSGESPPTGSAPHKGRTGIIVPLATFMGFGMLSLLIFCWGRLRFKDIYAPRSCLSGGRPPKLPNTYFTWLPTLLSFPESVLITTVGLDGVILLRFFRSCRHFFLCLSVLGLLFIAPVNYYANPPSPEAYANSTGILYEDIFVRALTVENVPYQSKFLYVHLFFTWLFSFIAYAYLIQFYRGIVELKQEYIEQMLRRTQMSKIEMRSIIVFGIPRELRHEVDLASYFEGLGIGKVENVVICRKWTHLREAVSRREYYLTQLETVYAQAMRNAAKRPVRLPVYSSEDSILSPLTLDTEDPSVFELMSRISALPPSQRPKHRTGFLGLLGATVSSAEYYAERYKFWDQRVSRLRRSPENSAPTSAGFVTFESPESAILASQALIHRRPFACMVRSAPEPRDLFWVNLSSKGADSYIKMFRSLIVVSTQFMLVFFSTIIVSAISALISLDNLQETFPGLKQLLQQLSPTTTQFIQSVIPTIVTAAWTSSLPGVLILLAQLQGLEAQSWIDQSVLGKYFFYQLWNVLLVQTVASKIWQSAVDVVRHGPGEIIDALGSLVPSASPLQISYVLLQSTLVPPLQLLLLFPLLATSMTRMYASITSSSTPRQLSNAYYPSVFFRINYGTVYPVPILIFCVGVVYGVVSPMILAFCTGFFAGVGVVYKYMLLYVNIPTYETLGSHAPMAIRRCLVGIFIMQCTMMGVLALKAGTGIKWSDAPAHPDMDSLDKNDKPLKWSGYVQMVIGVMPLLMITSLMFWWLRQGFEKLMEYPSLDIVGKVARELNRVNVNEVGLNGNGEGVVVGEQLTGKELGPLTKREERERRLSKRTSIKAIRGRQRRVSISNPGTSGTGRGASYGSFDGLAQPSDGRLSVSLTDRLDGDVGREDLALASPTSSHATSPVRPTSYFSQYDGTDRTDTSMALFENSVEIEESQHLLSPTPSDNESDEESQRAGHLEPPMTRVPGVLDAPFISATSIISTHDDARAPISDGDDLQLHTYLHPALIGRLPVAWIPGAGQPRRLEEAREAQKTGQMGLYRRIVGRQRIGVWELNDDSNLELAEDGDEPRDIPGFPRGRRRRDSTGVARRVMSIVDGLTSWAHLSMS
ncbi:hypothetical protein BC832DRAFT_575403 [Gaertneriomyces semiglobifer]|nr:hypothetical protein BC832DRAFT_575403 [Gaertneriomyces semiglobifer]